MIPPANRVPYNLGDDRQVMKVSSYTVGSWTPQRDGKGVPEAVMLTFEVEGLPCDFGIRFKTAEKVDQLIEALKRHLNNENSTRFCIKQQQQFFLYFWRLHARK